MPADDEAFDLATILSEASGVRVEEVETSFEPASAPVARPVGGEVYEVAYAHAEEWPAVEFFGSDRQGSVSDVAESRGVPVAVEGRSFFLVPPAGTEDEAEWARTTASDYLAWSAGETFVVVRERWRISDHAPPMLQDTRINGTSLSLENATAMASATPQEGPAMFLPSP